MTEWLVVFTAVRPRGRLSNRIVLGRSSHMATSSCPRHLQSLLKTASAIVPSYKWRGALINTLMVLFSPRDVMYARC